MILKLLENVNFRDFCCQIVKRKWVAVRLDNDLEFQALQLIVLAAFGAVD